MLDYTTGVLLLLIIFTLLTTCIIHVIFYTRLSNSQKLIWGIFILAIPLGTIIYSILRIGTIGKDLFKTKFGR